MGIAKYKYKVKTHAPTQPRVEPKSRGTRHKTQQESSAGAREPKSNSLRIAKEGTRTQGLRTAETVLGPVAKAGFVYVVSDRVSSTLNSIYTLGHNAEQGLLNAGRAAEHAAENAFHGAEEEVASLLAAGENAARGAATKLGGGSGAVRAAESLFAIAAVAGTVYVAYEGYRYIRS